MAGYFLTLLDGRGMWTLSPIIHTRLKPGERAFLAVSALMALEDD